MQRLLREPGRHLTQAIAFGHRKGATTRTSDREALVLHDEHSRWWRQPNVVGLGIGRKVSNDRLGSISLVVFVRRKRPEGRLKKGHIVPKKLDASPIGFRQPVTTDVREVGIARAQSLAIVERPARPGYSVGSRTGGSGSIGCVVRDQADDARLGLTCAHVLSPALDTSGGGRVFVPSYPEAKARRQVGQADFGVVRQILPPDFSPSAHSNCDLATFEPSDPKTLDATIALLGGPPAGSVDDLTEGLVVRKVGAVSELTTGEVKFVNMVFNLAYPTAGGDELDAQFEGVVGTSHLSEPGDSGSLVLTPDRQAVGIVLGSTPEMTICLPIREALTAVACDLVAS